MKAPSLIAALCLLPGLALAQTIQPPPHVEININPYPPQLGPAPQVLAPAAPRAPAATQAITLEAAPAEATQDAELAPEAESHLSVGFALGTTHWGPTLSLRSEQGVAVSFTFVPMVIDGDPMGHIGLRLIQDLRSRRSSNLYGVLGLGVSAGDIDDPMLAAGVGLGIRRVPRAQKKASLWGEMKLTALAADGEVMAFLPLPTVGISWDF